MCSQMMSPIRFVHKHKNGYFTSQVKHESLFSMSSLFILSSIRHVIQVGRYLVYWPLGRSLGRGSTPC